MTKINQALIDWIPGSIHGHYWFKEKGIGTRLAYFYYEQGVLEKVGPGVYSKKNDPVTWQGLVNFLQQELNLSVHISGKTALELQGASHYTNMRRPRISLVSYEVKELPSWVYKVSQDFELNFKKSSLLSKEEYLHSQVEQKISVSLSQRELAVLELIDELDLKNGFETVENYMNSLMTLRSSVLQEILENCKSIKVKRVFLYLSEKLELPYFYELNQAKIDIGSGKRVVVEGGKLDKKYNITVESEEEENPF